MTTASLKIEGRIIAILHVMCLPPPPLPAPHIPHYDRCTSDHVLVHETVRDANETVPKQGRANFPPDAFMMNSIFWPFDPGTIFLGVENMQNLLMATFLAFAPAAIVIPHAGELTVQGTGTAFEIARQYADGGTLGGVASDHTGTTFDVGQGSMNFLGTPDRIAADWPMPPVIAKGD